MEALSHMSYLGVFIANIVAFMFGGLWYTILFGKAWKSEMGIDTAKEQEMQASGSMVKAMIVGFMTGLVSTFVMAYLLHAAGMLSISAAFTLSLLIGLGIVGMTVISDGFYSEHSLKLIAIDTVYRVLQLIIVSVVYVLLADFGWQG